MILYSNDESKLKSDSIDKNVTQDVKLNDSSKKTHIEVNVNYTQKGQIYILNLVSLDQDNTLVYSQVTPAINDTNNTNFSMTYNQENEQHTIDYSIEVNARYTSPLKSIEVFAYNDAHELTQTLILKNEVSAIEMDAKFYIVELNYEDFFEKLFVEEEAYLAVNDEFFLSRRYVTFE